MIDHGVQRGCFLTIEGIEGVGKTTALHFIEDYLSKSLNNVVVTREPGGTAIAEAIRNILLSHHEEKMCSETELLLLFAGRMQHLSQVIIPALNKGRWVVCDRFTDASYAYQGGGRGLPMDKIAILERWVQGDLRPDKVIVLDSPVEIGMERIRKRSPADRIEQEKKQFFEKVRATYLQRAQKNPQRYTVIDASLSLEEVHEQIAAVLDDMLVTCSGV